jgi:hypothetical protein
MLEAESDYTCSLELIYAKFNGLAYLDLPLWFYPELSY